MFSIWSSLISSRLVKEKDRSELETFADVMLNVAKTMDFMFHSGKKNRPSKTEEMLAVCISSFSPKYF